MNHSAIFRVATSLCAILLLVAAPTSADNEDDWMPDPHLERAIRKSLEIQDEIPMRPQDLAALTHLVVEHNVMSLQGFEYATNLEFLHLGRTEVSDLSPLAKLDSLRILKLFNNHISDLAPLANLTNLEVLQLQSNEITNISALGGLTNLKELDLSDNHIIDFTPIYELGIETLYLGSLPIDSEVIRVLDPADRPTACNIPGTSTLARIDNRTYPSVFAAWHNIVNRPTLSWEQRLSYHDLYFCCVMFDLYWYPTADGMAIAGDSRAQQGSATNSWRKTPICCSWLA